MDFTEKPQNIISICTGIRGLETGLELAGVTIQPVVYVETEAVLIANLVAGMEAGVLAPTAIFTDVKQFNGKPFRGKIHGITAGYSCQPFSTAGQRKGAEDPRHLFPHISRIIEEIRPIWCLFENVAGHLSLGYGEVYRSLRDLGYTVEPGIYTAEEVGAPHERKRLFILAVEDSARGRSWVSQMDHTSSIRQQPEFQISTRRDTVEFSSETMANAMCFNGGLSEPEGWKNSIQITRSSEELADSKCAERGAIVASKFGCDSDNIQQQRQEGSIGFEQCSKELANTSCELQHRDRKSWGRGNEYSDGNSAVADTSGNNAQGVKPSSTDTEEWEEKGERPIGSQSVCHQWPARPGQDQHEWEYPRSITRAAQSDVGLSASRYDFREDFLRALGNAVVPQTAAIAFIDLLKKHIKNQHRR